MKRYIAMVPALFVLGACGQDSSFTKLLEPEPSAEDTSAPPVEAADDVVPEVPETCPDALYSAQLATVDEACRNDPPTWRYTPVIEWKMDAFDEFPEAVESMGTPVVGHFTDDDGDGALGSAGDIPDVAALFLDGMGENDCGNNTHGSVLRLISGDGTEVHWSVREVIHEGEVWLFGNTGISAIGDIDGDGEPEIVTQLHRERGEVETTVAAFDRHGNVEWVTEDPGSSNCCFAPWSVDSAKTVIGIWDLDQDGVPEVFGGSKVYSGVDGTRVLPDFEHGGFDVAVVDLEKDGTNEIITPEGIFEQDGTARCNFGVSTTARNSFRFIAVADLDGDGRGNPVVTGDGSVHTFDERCLLFGRAHLDDGGAGGSATIADYDGDGMPEIGTASSDTYYVFEGDGTPLWRHPVTDQSSNVTASSVYDFEGDGYAEVVYAGEENLWVFAGYDGTPRLVDSSQDSCTYAEYPVTVDVDGDGQVEIVLQDANGIRVVGDRDNGWVPARQVWNQHAYSITNVNDDLSIPTYAEPNWPEYNSFRSADLRINDGQGALLVDAYPLIVDICEIECREGTVQIVFQGANQGLADAGDGMLLSLYAEQADGSRTLLQTLDTETILRAGYTTEGYPLELNMTDIPTGTLILIADDDGTGMGVIDECDEDNNELRLEGLCADE